MVRLADPAPYASLASPGTKACDAGGGAFRPEWREGPVRTWCPSAISCAPDAILQRKGSRFWRRLPSVPIKRFLWDYRFTASFPYLSSCALEALQSGTAGCDFVTCRPPKLWGVLHDTPA